MQLTTGTSRQEQALLNERLNSVNWDFPTSDTSRDIHSIHPYPAKFIAEIPRTLIDILGVPEGTVILDPFCGSGTTLVEAQLSGFPAIGIDLNPIACLQARVKTTSLPKNFLGVAEKCLEEAKATRVKRTPDIPNVNHWFKPEIQHAISALVEAICHVENQSLKEALQLSLSSIIVRVSNQDSDTRYAAVDKKVSPNDVFSLFIGACAQLERAKSDLGLVKETVDVLEKNILEVTVDDISQPVGLVITSPPYPNAYEYWLYHKYRMWWLGYNPLEVKQHEIGARAHYFKKNHQTVDDFIQQMRTTLTLLNSCVVSSGYICFVIGRSIIHGNFVDNAAILESLAMSLGLKVFFKKERHISANRKSFNLSHARIKTETILILQKD